MFKFFSIRSGNICLVYLIAKLGKSKKLLGITDASRMDLSRVLFYIRVYFFDSLFFQKC